MAVLEQDVVRQIAGVTETRLRAWVAEGWVSPARGQIGHVYTEIDIARCAMICQFEDELEIDRETMPVVLRLLDQIHGLRQELRTALQAIDQQGPQAESTATSSLNPTTPS